ncbi:gastrin/cholecystokinin type B receptor [Eublepharis macularius]|uniref:Gastrin/cholecystokinin type B receptor n=1 Tax=Eublepharis macularius TaxID=481883 RepID=A0AA97KU68_EUBMA|nr:gastrin/cholecystokinin type B receptor [Eublepharis macularius]
MARADEVRCLEPRVGAAGPGAHSALTLAGGGLDAPWGCLYDSLIPHAGPGGEAGGPPAWACAPDDSPPPGTCGLEPGQQPAERGGPWPGRAGAEAEGRGALPSARRLARQTAPVSTAPGRAPRCPEQTRRASRGRPLPGDAPREAARRGGPGRAGQGLGAGSEAPQAASESGSCAPAKGRPSGGERGVGRAGAPAPSRRPGGRQGAPGGWAAARGGRSRGGRASGGAAAGLREAPPPLPPPLRRGAGTGAQPSAGMEAPRPLNESLLCSPGNGSAGGAWNGTGAGCDAARRPPRGSRDLDVTVRLLLYSIIFLLGVFGNTLVIAVLVRNKRLRTVTNSFLLSLSLSDLLVALFCIPFTFIPNVMGTFIFGKVVCKAVAYFMGMSVSVSTFSLVAIAIERYNAICKPLQSRVWQTRSHAYRVIVATWLLSALLMLPYPVYTTTISQATHPGIYQCHHNWPGNYAKQAWSVILLVVLFLIPGLVMIVAYGLISWELYRGMQFEMDLTREARAQQNGDPRALAPCDEGDGCYIQVSRSAGGAVELSVLTSEDHTKEEQARVNRSEAKLQAKKHVIRMLVVVVLLFFVCWLPIYVVNTWRAFAPDAAYRALSGAPISFIHLLSYISTCVNPFIYCFMNKRFRKALAATCACCVVPCRPRPRPPDDEVTATGASLSKFSYTTVSSLGPP